jgi:TetR/AcrR family transcriptional regulator, ethionamide resistance regulator
VPSVTRRERRRGSRVGAEERLVEATERLLAEGTPYIGLSVEQLCSEAGVARSTFYVHFRDKGELVTRVAALMLDQLSAAAEAWWVPGADRRELLVATRALVDVYARHRAVMTALTETAAYDGVLREVHQAMVDRHAEPLAALIEQGKGDGVVRELHTRETVVALVGMVQVACDRLAGGDDADLDRLAEAITAIAWHALFPDAAQDAER